MLPGTPKCQDLDILSHITSKASEKRCPYRPRQWKKEDRRDSSLGSSLDIKADHQDLVGGSSTWSDELVVLGARPGPSA